MSDQATANALWYVAPGHAEIRSETLPPLKSGAVRIRALHGAISRGTESLVFAGRVPESEVRRMRPPFMGGDFPFPVKYGYATVGTVVAGEGQGGTVFALHPHQALFDVPANAVVAVPQGVPAYRGILAANMETALNAMWDSEPYAPAGGYKRVAVIGAGVVGALCAFLLAKQTAVTLIDVDPVREKLARALGVAFSTPDDAPRDYDLVVHASGNPAGLATAFEIAADEAPVLELSWYGEGTVPVLLGGDFHSRRLKLISSQVGMVAPSRRHNTSHRARLEAALALLTDERLEALIASAVRFDDLTVELPRILSPGSGVLCQRIDYPA